MLGLHISGLDRLAEEDTPEHGWQIVENCGLTIAQTVDLLVSS